ncbi:MAG: hypothetical protein ACOCUS_04950, partial [Polyangiales bacterium]
PPPPWPFSRRALGGAAAGALALFVAVVVLMREGMLGPAAALELGWYDSERVTDVESRLQTDVGPAGLPLPPTLQGAYLECDVACDSGGPVCASFERWLVCDDERGDKPAGAERAEVEIELRGMEAPGCWMPLYKQGRVEPAVRITIHEKQGEEDRTQRVRIDATVDETLTGLASCRTLHERLGHAVAEIVAQRLQKIVEG